MSDYHLQQLAAASQAEEPGLLQQHMAPHPPGGLGIVALPLHDDQQQHVLGGPPPAGIAPVAHAPPHGDHPPPPHPQGPLPPHAIAPAVAQALPAGAANAPLAAAVYGVPPQLAHDDVAGGAVNQEPASLEQRYQDKCAECNALRQQLELKTQEVRRLQQELYKKTMNNVSINAMGNISSHGNKKAPPPAPLIDTEKLIIDVDIGPSSSRTRSYDQRWKARFQDLVKFKLQHGHCVVPKSHTDKALHSWVRKQRILKKDFDLGLASDESMTQERVDALNSVGFAWHVGHQSNDSQWDQNFQDLVVFKSQFGHTRVPQSYDKSLHKWVLNQRCRRRLLEDKGEGKAKGMTWQRIEKLDAVDFSWTGKK